MLDLKWMRENLDVVRDGARRKRIDCDVDRCVALDDERKTLEGVRGDARAEQNRIGKEIAKLSGDEKQQAIASQGELKQKIKDAEKRLQEVEEELHQQMSRIPMPPGDEVPDGVDDTENVELSTWGEIPKFDFEPKDHVTLGLDLGIMDFQHASKLAGSQTYILRGAGALLEIAVLRLALDTVMKSGFEPMIVPTLVKYEPLYGTAYFPGGEEQAYKCEKDELYLTGTSEVPVTAFHSGEILEESELPKLYSGYSTCYRREAGAAGRDTKGLYRIHQFNKVEQVVICRNDPEESLRHHKFILDTAKSILEVMEIPYRVVNVCTGDLGMGQIQKFDIESWMPSRGGYGETHSASRFHDFQSRRLNMRYRDADGKVRFCHTLNNTAIATPRVLISIIENNQQADGSVRIPEVLVPYMNGLEVIEASR
ncbi:MAG: serine--tRNA ligase [Planctomycetota bacterium]